MPEFSQTICPIWFRVANGYELEGTGVLIKIGKYNFLLTAAHVLDRANGISSYIGLPNGYVQISGIAKSTTPPNGDRNQDRIDIGFIALDDAVTNRLAESKAFLPIQYVDVLDEGGEQAFYAVNGCPSKKVTKEGRVFHPQIYQFGLTGKSHTEYSALGILPMTHIAMEFDRRKMTNGSGRRVESPKLGGVSGSPVWKLVQAVSSSGQSALTKRLAGIVIEHLEAKRTLVATRISGVLAGIAHNFPDIKELIPQNPKLTVLYRNTAS